MDPVLVRFESKWELDQDGCHVWTGWLDPDGYGRFAVAGRTYRPHRWFFQYVHGWLPPEVMHECDKPACVKEQHLIPGTKSDNMRDMIAKGRGRNQFGHPSRAALVNGRGNGNGH